MKVVEFQTKVYNSNYQRIKYNPTLGLKRMQSTQVLTPQQAFQFTSLINEFLNYNSSKSTNKHAVKLIEDKLMEYSKNDHFFQVAFEFIMNKPNPTFQELFIVSLLLRDKFRYGFDKYSDQNSIVYLQNIIKQIMKKYSDHPPDTFTANICVCMICLYIKRSEQLKAQFKQIGILEYFKSFVQDKVSSDYFYKALELAPEEVCGSKIVMDQDKKDRVRSLLKYGQYQVLKHLNTVAAQLWDNKLIKKRHLFSALQNWISMGYKEALFHELPNHFLVQKLFDSCLDSAISTQATNCIKEIIKRLKTPKKDQGLFAFLGNGVFKLVELIKENLKEFSDTNQVNEAIEVVAEFGILATEFFVKNYDANVKNFLQSVILFLKIQDLDAFPNLMDFLEAFVTQIQHTNSLNAEYVEILNNAYAAVCFRTKWSLEMMEKMNDISERNLSKFYNEADSIGERREIAESFFEALSFTFGKDNYLDFVLSCISRLPKTEPQIFWPYFQSYLDSLQHAVVSFPRVTQSLKMLIQSYSEVSEYVVIKLDYLKIFKSLMSIKEPNPAIKGEFIKHLFTLIAQNLNNHKVEEKAQRAFSKGCEENPEIVINYIDNFIALLKQHNGNEEIVKGIMHVLDSNFDAMNKYLPEVLQVLYQVFTTAKNSLMKKYAYQSLYELFKILMTYKQKDQFRDTIVEFTKSVWEDVIKNLTEPKDIINDEDPEVERAVKLVKYLMRFLRDGFIPFLESLFTTVFEAYRKHPICSYVYVLEVSITVFYDDATLTDYFRTLYQSFCQITYAHLKQKQNIADYQLLIDDFIGMNKRFFIYNSQIVLQSGELPSLIETCINLSGMIDVPQVSRSAYQFFETMFMVYWSDDFIQQYNINDYGDKFEKDPKNQHLYSQLKHFILPKLPETIMKMINHLQKVPLESTADCISDALMSEIKGFSEVNKEIWTPILEAISCEILTNTEKAEIYELLSSVGSVDIEQSREAAERIQQLIYRMKKRFVNSYKRKI